jgi:hypothetical protein
MNKLNLRPEFNINESFLSNENNEAVEMNNCDHKMITVLISGGSTNPVTIVARKYQYGDSVAKFINLCEDLNIFVKQNNSDKVFKIFF